MAKFEELVVWKDAMKLAVSVYGQFDGSRDFSFRDQVCRSAVSIPSNIAEGSERGSNKDFVRFLRISLGSSAELRTQLYLAERLQKCEPAVARGLVEQTARISAQLNKLVAYLSTHERTI